MAFTEVDDTPTGEVVGDERCRNKVFKEIYDAVQAMVSCLYTYRDEGRVGDIPELLYFIRWWLLPWVRSKLS